MPTTFNLKFIDLPPYLENIIIFTSKDFRPFSMDYFDLVRKRRSVS